MISGRFSGPLAGAIALAVLFMVSVTAVNLYCIFFFKPARDSNQTEYDSSIATESVEKTTEIISGKVFSEEGTPLENVLIYAQIAGEPLSSHLSDFINDDFSSRESTVIQSMNDAIQKAIIKVASRTSTRTDANGNFTLTDLYNAIYSVNAHVEGYVFFHATGGERIATGIKPGESIRFIGSPVFPVTIDVFLENDTEPDYCMIEYVFPDRFLERIGLAKSHHWTPCKNTIYLEPGRYSMKAYTGDNGEYRSEPELIFVQKSKLPQNIVIIIRKVNGITGSIDFEPGVRIEDLKICLISADSSEPVSHAWATGYNNWNFGIYDVEPGVYSLGIDNSDYGIKDNDIFFIDDGIVTKNIILTK